MSYHVINGTTGCIPDNMVGCEDWEGAKAEVMLIFDDLEHEAYTALDIALDNADEFQNIGYKHEFKPEDDAGADYVSIEPCKDGDDCEICDGVPTV